MGVLVDPAITEIIRNRLESITREMCVIMRRTAHSPTMYSGGDYSAGIFDGAGQLISLSTKIPMHIMPIIYELQQGLEKFGDDIQEGDVFANNSPFHGSTHVPDVNVFMPIFVDSELLAFSALRAHWIDIGGMTPGSISGKATEIFQEGLQLPVIRLGRGGKLDSEIMDIIRANVRLPREAMGDLHAQVAACRTCRKYLLELAEKYGLETVKQAWSAIVDGTERRVRGLIQELAKMTVSHFEYLDNDGISLEPVRTQVAITVEDDEVIVDYTGSSPQVRGCINATEAGSCGMAYVGIKSFLDPDGPINHGLIRPIRVMAPPGTVVNAQPPAATGGSTEINYNLANLVVAALGDIDPSRVCACGSSSGTHQYIAGFRHDDGQRFIYYEYQPGGCGATNRFDGACSSRDLASGYTAMTSMEVLESRFPLKIRRHEIIEDSGGPGCWRGGVSHIREVQVYGTDLEIATIAEHAWIPPYGLADGYSGRHARWSVISDDCESELSPFGAKSSGRPIPDGGIVRVITAGGGGFGDPLERDPELVAADVRAGYVSVEAAEARYGVVLAGNGVTDTARTDAARETLRGQRIQLSVEAIEDKEFEGGFHVVRLHPRMVERLGTSVELLSGRHCASVRVLTREMAESYPESSVGVGPDVRRVLRVAHGDSVGVRAFVLAGGSREVALEQVLG